MNTVHRKTGLIDTALEAGKIPPQAPECEQAVIGAAMLEVRAFGEVNGWLKPEHFYVIAHQTIWQACLALYERSEPVDILTVTQELLKCRKLDSVGGPFYISQLTNRVASSANVEWHGRIIVQYWIQREAIRIGSEAMRDGYDATTDPFELAERTSRMIDDMIEGVVKKQSVTLADVADEQLADMDKPRKPVHSTGFEKLDKALGGGYADGDLIIIAGRPGMGKSSFAFSGCMWAAHQGSPTALFSLELGEKKTNGRLQSIYTGIPLTRIISGPMPEGKSGDGWLTAEDISKIHKTHATYSKLPIYPNFNNGISMSELRSECARMKRRYGITAVYIDQLTWINVDVDRGGDRVAAVTRGCKRIAMELELPVILLHQLSRATVTRGGDKRPELTDLRDSGAAEQDAQVVIFPHRPEYYNIGSDDLGSTRGRADIIIAKNSNGPLTTVPLYFDAPCTAFRDSEPFNLFSTKPHPDNRTEAKKEDEPQDLPF